MEKPRKRKLNKQDLSLIYIGISLVLLLIYLLTLEIRALILIGITPIVYFIHSRLIYIKLVNKLEDQRYFDVFLKISEIEEFPDLLSIEEITKITDPYFLDPEKKWNKDHDKIHYFYEVKLTNPIPGTKPFDRFILILDKLFTNEFSFPKRTILFDGFEVGVPVSTPREFIILDWKEEIPIIINVSPNEFDDFYITKDYREKMIEECYNDMLKNGPTIFKIFENYYFITLIEPVEIEIQLDKDKEPEVKSFDKFILRTTKTVEREEIINQINTFQFVEMLGDSSLFEGFDMLTELNVSIPIFKQIALDEKS